MLPVRRALAAAVIGCALVPLATLAQETDRPRTCLVLSGGGARGAAHVGVLEVLEELRVPFDCVAGTSMGAIVGGLYAAGLTPAELRSEIETIDWERVLEDRLPRRQLPFRRKQDDLLPLFDVEFGVSRKGLATGSGLIAGQRLDVLIKELTIGAAGRLDFDELVVPYRAVATDLGTGRMFVLDRGHLAAAMRASMAVPGAFTPVDIDGVKLIDGGVSRNLPVDVARTDLGAQRVIAVDVGSPLEDLEDSLSVFGVAYQTMIVLTQQNVDASRASLAPEDFLLVPDLGETTSTAFAKAPEIVGMGRAAAEAAAADLRRYAVSEDEYRVWRERLEARRRMRDRPVHIDAVEIDPTERVDRRIIERQIRARPGRDFDPERVKQDIDRIYRLGDFETVGFRIETTESGTTLEYEPVEKPWGPNFLRVGLGMEADLAGESRFELLADFTKTRINALGAEWKSRLAIGTDNRLMTEFYQPLDFEGRWFGSALLGAGRREVEFYATEFPTILNRVQEDDITVGADLGVQYGNYGELRVGLRRGIVWLDGVIPGAIESERIETGGFAASVILDRLDNVYFPRDGYLLAVRGFLSREALGADIAYEQAGFRYEQPVTFGENTLVANLELSSGLGSDVPGWEQPTLGGFLRLSGLRPDSIRGAYLGYAGLSYYRRLGALPGLVGGGVFAGLSVELGNAWPTADLVDLHELISAGAVWIGVDTVFVPVFFGVGAAEGGEHSLHLALGRAF